MFSPISALKSRTTIILSYCDKNKSKLLLIVCRWLLLLSVCENIELQDWSLILAFSFYQGYQKLQSPNGPQNLYRPFISCLHAFFISNAFFQLSLSVTSHFNKLGLKCCFLSLVYYIETLSYQDTLYFLYLSLCPRLGLYKLFSSILIHPSKLIDPFPPLYPLRYNLSTSLLGCSAPCIVINFLVLWSELFNSSVFLFRIPAPYLITETTQILTAVI